MDKRPTTKKTRQDELLLIIDKACEAPQGKDSYLAGIFWIPDRRGEGPHDVFGSGDAASLRALERKGLIRFVNGLRNSNGSRIDGHNRFAAIVTEEGRLRAQELI